MGRQQHPLTPPEYQTPYTAPGYNAMSYQHGSFATLPAPSFKPDAAYEYADRRGHGLAYQPSLPSLVYPQASAYTNPNVSAAQSSHYYGSKMATILPPLVSSHPPTYEQAVAAEAAFGRRHHMAAQDQQPQAKAEKAVGGVALKLDYEMDIMTNYVAEMAHGMYALFTSSLRIAEIDLMRSIQPRTQRVDPAFRKWVNQVLCATRLPMATILLSLSYLQIRLTQLSATERYDAPDQRQRLLTVALILGSKFCDDNTFINRSWSEVSGIEVKILNLMEIRWFEAMDHRLHRDPREASGFNAWHTNWLEYEASEKSRRSSANLKLSPLDTNVVYNKAPRASSLTSALASADHAYNASSQNQYESMQYDTPTYTPYDTTWYPRSATDHSPASAPHTGPTTPEYYSNTSTAPAAWYGGNEGYSRRTMFGIPSSQTTIAHPAQAPYPIPPHYAGYAAGHQLPQLSMPYMNGHPLGCACYQCAKSPTNYYLTHHPFGQAMPVAG